MFNRICKIILLSYFCCLPYCITIYKQLKYILSFPIGCYKKIILYFYPTTNVILVKNSTIYYRLNYSNIYNYLPIDYDYLIYTETIDCKTIIKIMTDINQLTNLQNSNQILELCNFEFIMVLIKGKNYSIDITNILKNKNNYYYIQGAILFNAEFLNWISINHLKKKLDDYYYILMLDNNMNEVILEKDKFIELTKDSYKVISKDNN